MRGGTSRGRRLGALAAHLCSGNAEPADDSPPPDEFWFSDGYEHARERFIEAVAGLDNAEHFALPLEPVEYWGGKNPDAQAFEGGRLTIDVAVVKGEGAAADSGPLTVHLSGVHGLEAFAGCAIQLKFLADLAAGRTAVPADTTTILVHCVNPYGFKYSRRYNENNVDLNRNFIVPGVADEFDATGQAVLDAAGRPKPLTFEWLRSSHPLMEAHDKFVAPWAKWTRPWEDGDEVKMMEGKKEYTRALAAALGVSATPTEASPLGEVYAAPGGVKQLGVSGQYYDREGTFYGGERLQASHTALLQFLEQRCGRYDPVMMVDVHSGLPAGPGCDDTVMLIAAPGTEAFVQEFTETALGDPKDEGYTLGDPLDKGNASAGYELMRGHLAGYLGAMKLAAAGGGWTRGAYIVQEFATNDTVGLAGARDSAAFVHGAAPEEYAAAKRMSENAFYVRTPEWRAAIIRRGTDVLRRMQAGLQQRHAELPAVAGNMRVV